MSPVPGLTLSGNTGVYGVATSFFGGSNSVAVMASSERYTISDPFFSYTFAIPVLAQTSPLTARLWFSENYAPAMTTGFRVFNVAVNGVVCLSNFDIFASTGAGYALISRDCVISPSTSLTVTLARIGGHNDPKVDGIEIFSGSSNAVTPAPTTLAPSTVAPTSAPTSVLILARINCGGYAFTDSATGNFWADDSTATITGSTFTYGVAQQPAFGTNTLAPMLSSERWGNAASNQMSFVFQLPTIGDASTSYTLRMHFAEIYPAAFVGFRVFNVLVNGQQFLKNFDIFSAAGSQVCASSFDFLFWLQLLIVLSLYFVVAVEFGHHQGFLNCFQRFDWQFVDCSVSACEWRKQSQGIWLRTVSVQRNRPNIV
jgi:hypothetical protein